MSGDALVYDMANSSRKDPSVFVKKDWLAISDDMNQNYAGNQVVIQTSAISASNKYIDYRQGYLTVPLLLTLTSNSVGSSGKLSPATSGTSCDFTLGLKNWIGSVIHNLTIDFNGTTIAQQTNYLPVYNNFKLMTTLSASDYQMFSSIGFSPDDAMSISFQTGDSENGIGVANNQNSLVFPVVTGAFNSYETANKGLLKRQMYFNYDPAGTSAVGVVNSAPFSSLLSTTYANQLYKSYIFNKVNAGSANKGVFQQAITGIVYLRHLHDFFDKMPLLKGVFLKMTMGISNTSVAFSVASSVISGTTVTNALGGVQPLMIASALTGNGSKTLPDDGYIASLSVGSKCLNTTQSAISGVINSPLAQGITLNLSSYVFQPQMEIAYLSNPIKRITYTDLYQFTVQNIASGSQFNSLITNGIANLQKVVCVPFLTASSNGGSLHQLQSPFDGAGGGTTAPLCHLGAFNIVVSGANVFLNSVRYNYEMFNNHVMGINSINSSLTDGMGSSLINSLDWETAYSYYVADVGRSLEVESDIPKSLSVVGQNLSGKEIDLFVFAEYETEIIVDALTSSRV